MRFYQVDKVTEICPGRYVEGVKCVSLDNDIFDEHFPGCPIFPGTLIIEGMAQLYPDEYGAVAVKAIRDGRVCAEGELLFTFLDILDDGMQQVSDALMRFATRDAKIIR